MDDFMHTQVSFITVLRDQWMVNNNKINLDLKT